MDISQEKVVLFHGVVDLRKGASGLLAVVGSVESDTLYLFSNRSRTLVKAVSRDATGISVRSRRLHRGHFFWMEEARGSSVIEAELARSILRGDRIKKSI